MGEKTDRIRRPERSPCLVIFARVALHVLEWEGCARELRPSCMPPSRKLQDVRYDELDDDTIKTATTMRRVPPPATPMSTYSQVPQSPSRQGSISYSQQAGAPFSPPTSQRSAARSAYNNAYAPQSTYSAPQRIEDETAAGVQTGAIGAAYGPYSVSIFSKFNHKFFFRSRTNIWLFCYL